MPFLAVTLLWMLNTDRTPAQGRNKPASNVALAMCTLAFATLAANETRELITTLVMSRAAVTAQASTTTGMIIGRRRCLLDTQRPTTRLIVCCSW